MLDFSKLASQIHSLEKASFEERIEHQEALQSALKALESASENQQAFLQRLDQSAGSVLWPLSVPLNGLNSKVAVSEHKSEIVRDRSRWFANNAQSSRSAHLLFAEHWCRCHRL